MAFGVIGSMWAERYGVKHLGAIRSLATVLMVASTAISPPLLGALLDHGVSMRVIAYALCAYAVAASVLVAVGGRGPRS